MKKLLRSLLVHAPGIQDARFKAEARVLRLLGRPFRKEYAGLKALVADDQLVVDIGCNRGISISTFRSMMPAARIVGYEPNAALAAATASMFAPDPRVEIRPVALGMRIDAATLYLPVYRGYRFDGFASFDRDAAAALVDDRLVYGLDMKRLVIEEQRVTIRPLDDEGLDPSVIKLYVQGHERAVLEGARRTIARNEPVILVPAQHGEVDALLRRWGYGRYQWHGDRFEREDDSGYVVYYMTPGRARAAGIGV